MENRTIYETIMSNENLSLDEINSLISEPYNSIIEFDYPYPNFNTIKPFVYSSKQRLKNIKKLYYLKNCENYWSLL